MNTCTAEDWPHVPWIYVPKFCFRSLNQSFLYVESSSGKVSLVLCDVFLQGKAAEWIYLCSSFDPKVATRKPSQTRGETGLSDGVPVSETLHL